MKKPKLMVFGPSASCSTVSDVTHAGASLDGSYELIFQVHGSRLGTEEMGGKGGGPNGGLGSTMSKEWIEDDYYDDRALSERKRRLTLEQVNLLEKSFEADNKLEPERKGELARELGLHPRQIAIWFQNRRARWKIKQLERDYDHLKALYDTLLIDHGCLLTDNQRLRDEVALLTDQLQEEDSPHNAIDNRSKSIVSERAQEVKAPYDVEVDTTYAIPPRLTIEPIVMDDHLKPEGHASSFTDKVHLILPPYDAKSCLLGSEEGSSLKDDDNYVISLEVENGGDDDSHFLESYNIGSWAIISEHEPLETEVGGSVGWWIRH